MFSLTLGVECKDIYAHCEENFRPENCEISGWARRNCQKFCNLCPVLGSSGNSFFIFVPTILIIIIIWLCND